MTLGLVIAVCLGGALIAAQGPIYARMSTDLGSPLVAATVAFLIGACSLVLIMAMTASPLPTAAALRQTPLWVWPGGLIGVYVVVVSIFAVPRMGVATYMVVVIVGQLSASLAYDHFGAFGIADRGLGWTGLLGAALVILGAGLIAMR